MQPRRAEQLALDRLSDEFQVSDAPQLLEIAKRQRDDANWRQRAMARWALHRWGKLTPEVLLAAVRDENPLARFHGLRLVAEQPTLDNDVKLALASAFDSSDKNVVRAAADAAMQHPNEHAFAKLLDAIQANTSDVALTYVVRRALRAQLDQIELTAKHQVAIREAHVDARKSVADLCLTLESPASARLLLNLLQEDAIGTPNPAPYILHVMQRLRGDKTIDFSRLTQLTIDRCQSLELTQQMAVSAAFQHGVAVDQELPKEFHAWQNELIQRFNERYLNTSPNWQVIGGANSWSLEQRKATDGRTDEYLSSLPGGESSVSAMGLGPFSAPSELSFYVCGHRGDPNTVLTPMGDKLAAEHAGQPKQAGALLQSSIPDDCYVQLRDVATQRILRRAFAPRSDTARQSRLATGGRGWADGSVRSD